MKSSAKVVFGITSLLLALHALASSPVPIPEKYLELLRQTEAAIPNFPADASTENPGDATRAAVASASHQLQKFGTVRAFAGDTEGAIAAFDMVELGRGGKRRAAGAADLKVIEDAAVEDAIGAIVALARSKRVVLINEAHHVPMHRAFAQKLATELRKIGYTYLAAEAFGNAGEDHKMPAYVDKAFGYLTRDPVFADFANGAMADGWKLVSYEHSAGEMNGTPKEQMDARELGQATNLVNRIFSKDKDAKVLIFVGYGHLYKSSPPGGTVQMGQHLRNMTKLDMLHVDQTIFYAHSRSAAESPLYAAVIAKSQGNVPFVLRSKDGSYPVLHGMQARTDMQVIFPRFGVIDGRPEWLQTLAGRTPREVPRNLLPASGRRLIQAYRIPGGPNAVPTDNVLVEAGKPVPKLMLPKGEFRFAFED